MPAAVSRISCTKTLVSAGNDRRLSRHERYRARIHDELSSFVRAHQKWLFIILEKAFGLVQVIAFADGHGVRLAKLVHARGLSRRRAKIPSACGTIAAIHNIS